MITTRGFGDTLEIGRLKRQTSGMNELERTDAYLRNRIPPLVPQDLIIEVDERIDVKGNVIKPLDEAGAHAEIRKLKDRKIEAVAICTLWSTHNPSHERWLRDLVAEELPGVFISCSHEISPGVGEYARMSTTAGNAALGPLAGRYLSSLEAKLQNAGMKVPVLMTDMCRRCFADRRAQRSSGLCAVFRSGRRRDGFQGYRGTGRFRQYCHHGYRRHELRRWRDRCGQTDHAHGNLGRGGGYPRPFDRCGIDRCRRGLDRLCGIR